MSQTNAPTLDPISSETRLQWLATPMSNSLKMTDRRAGATKSTGVN